MTLSAYGSVVVVVEEHVGEGKTWLVYVARKEGQRDIQGRERKVV